MLLYAWLILFIVVISVIETNMVVNEISVIGRISGCCFDTLFLIMSTVCVKSVDGATLALSAISGFCVVFNLKKIMFSLKLY